MTVTNGEFIPLYKKNPIVDDIIVMRAKTEITCVNVLIRSRN